MSYKNSYYLLAFIFLSSCGGGGGGGSSAPSVPSASISFSTSFGSEVDVGTNFTFSWTTSNASSCSASGDWSGSVGISGNHQRNLESARQYSFTLSCLNSEGTQASKTLSVVANYILIKGTIFDSDNSSKVVYIDEDMDKIKDSNEPSATSNSNGYYEIRYSQDEQCLREFPVRVDGSNLNSFNPPGFDEVNISQATSLFEEIFNYTRAERYENSVLCDTWDSRQKKRFNNFFNEIMQDVTNSEGYSYSEIQSDPDLSSRNSISIERFNDIQSFNSSLASIESSLIQAIKNQIDSVEGGFNSSDFSFESRAELDDTNMRIFLNDTTYPNPTTDPSPVATSIENVSVQANIRMRIDNTVNLPGFDMNGWDEVSFIGLGDVLINNNNQVISDTSSCWINFTSLCLQDITFDLINLNDISVQHLYEWTKTTSRGLELMSWDERFIASSNQCDVFNDKIIFEDLGSDTYKTSGYVNNYYDAPQTDYGDGTPNYCIQYGGQQYKAMFHSLLFSDGSHSSFTWDSDQIDSLPDIVESGWYDEDYPPPNSIPQDIVNIMAERPNLYDTHPDWDLDINSNDSFTILNDFISLIMVNDIGFENSGTPFYYFSWWIRNTSGGVTNFMMTNENGYPYSRCSLNYQDISVSTNYGYTINNAYNTFIDCAFTTDESGLPIMSRQSTHTELNDIVCSPFSGCYQISTSATSNGMDEDSIIDKDSSLSGDGRNKRDQIEQRFNLLEEWSHLSDSN